MSTKNLARTVIEGGRARANRWERRYSNARQRTREHRASARLLTTSELEDVLYPRRMPVYRAFDDKLGPAERWLRSQVGRPWSKVRSELFARFDSRTTAGRHILFDHLLPSVSVEARGSSNWADFTVDRGGILRDVVCKRRRRVLPEPLPEAAEALAAWIGARRVAERGSRLFWFVPTESGLFRQHQALTEAEAARFRSLPEWFRKQCALSAEIPRAAT